MQGVLWRGLLTEDVALACELCPQRCISTMSMLVGLAELDFVLTPVFSDSALMATCMHVEA